MNCISKISIAKYNTSSREKSREMNTNERVNIAQKKKSKPAHYEKLFSH